MEAPAARCWTWMGTPPAEHQLEPRPVCRLVTSVVVEDGSGAAALREQGVAAVAEEVEEEVFVGLPLAIALDLDRDRLGRLSGRERQRAGLADVVLIAAPRGAVGGAV